MIYDGAWYEVSTLYPLRGLYTLLMECAPSMYSLFRYVCVYRRGNNLKERANQIPNYGMTYLLILLEQLLR